MSSSRDIPQRWAERLIARGFVDRRGGNGYSISALAQRAGLHTSTVSDAIHGKIGTKPETMRAIADHLGEDVVTWFGVPRLDPWTPPASAALLTERQRLALDELINAMTERRGHDDGTATTQGPESPAPNVTPMSGRRRGPSQPVKKAARRVDETPPKDA